LEACKSSVDFPLCFRDDQEWFSAKFKVWRDTRDLVFMLDLSSPVSIEFPLSIDIVRDYTLKFEIRVESALTNLREAIRDRDCCREIADTLMEDIEEMSSA